MDIYEVAPALHEALKNATTAIRAEFDRYNVPNMRFRIEVSGRVQGDLKVEYVLGELYDTPVVGSSPPAIVEEFMRRRGWNQRNAPLAIGYAGETVVADAAE